MVALLAWQLPSRLSRTEGRGSSNQANHAVAPSMALMGLPRPPKRPVATKKQHGRPYHRLALLLPFVGDGPEQIPAYLSLFCQGATAAADVADFFLIHNGVLSSITMMEEDESKDGPVHACLQANNVHLVHVGSTQAMAKLLTRVLVPDDKNKKRNLKFPASRLETILTAHLQLYPYTLVEYKPAYGYIFQDLLIHDGAKDDADDELYYTHWGYTDLDMVFGDLGRHLDESEWTDYDVVTFGFGDQERLYVKGQFTMHKNTVASRQVWWRECDYLSKMDERWYNMLSSNAGFQLESAEGCYSAALLERTDISIKYAVKAWTDVSTQDGVYQQGLYMFPRPNEEKSKKKKKKQIPMERGHVLVKLDTSAEDELSRTDEEHDSTSNKALSPSSLLDLAPDWFLTDPVYQDLRQPLQIPVAAMEPLSLPFHSHKIKDNDKEPHCMFWVQPKYQKYLCLTTPVSAQENVYWVKGKLYKQAFQNVNIPALRSVQGITGPFFHFQEWKRRFRSQQLAVLEQEYVDQGPASPSVVKVLLPEGAIVVPTSSFDAHKSNTANRLSKLWSSSSTSQTPTSPLGVPPTEWRACRSKNSMDDRSQLPSRLYCLSGLGDNHRGRHHAAASSKFKMECRYTLSWRNRDEIEFLSTAPGWNPKSKDRRSKATASKALDSELDVTLVQTVQISAAMGGQAGAAMLQSVRQNLNQWNGQPCVLLFQISPIVKDAAIEDMKAFATSLDDIVLDMCLIAVISSPLPGHRNQEQSFPNDNTSHKKEEFMDEGSDANLYNVNDEWIISEKALQNMAVDVVPTRWYITGVHHQGGQDIQLSLDTVSLTREKALAYQEIPGHVFWIPTLASSHDRHRGEEVLTLSHWIHGKENDDEHDTNGHRRRTQGRHDAVVGPPRLATGGNHRTLCRSEEKFEGNEDDIADIDDKKNILNRAIHVWWQQTLEFVRAPTHKHDLDAEDGENVKDLAERLNDLDYQFMAHLLEQGSHGGSDNEFQTLPYTLPILLVDNIGPFPKHGSSFPALSSSRYVGKTNLISREVEEYGGGGHGGCFPLLRLSQLVLFGYAWNALYGAFAVELSSSLTEHGGDDSVEEEEKDEQGITERFRRHEQERLCAGHCIFIEDENNQHDLDLLRDQILQHEVVRAVETRTFWEK